MSTFDQLVQSFQTTHWLVSKFADGMTHDESVVPPPFQANSFNWVLGHIVEHRDQVLSALEEGSVLTEEETALYRTGSTPVTSMSKAVDLERLLQALNESQERIELALSQSTPERLAALYDPERDQTVAARIAGLHWHETYHVGQLELLRQVSSPRPAFP